MSSMLEQAIADASALREQAIKNAEQSVLDKYSKQIKEAVDQMLEMEDTPNKADAIINEVEEELMQEEEAAAAAAGISDTDNGSAPIEAVASYDSRPGAEDLYTKISAVLENLPVGDDGMIDLDLGDFSPEQDEMEAADGGLGDPLGGLDDLGMDTPSDDTEGDLDGILGGDDELDLQLQEVLSMLTEEESEESEEDKIEETLTNELPDPIGDALGVWKRNRSREEFNAEVADVVYGDEEEDEASAEEDEVDIRVSDEPK